MDKPAAAVQEKGWVSGVLFAKKQRKIGASLPNIADVGSTIVAEGKNVEFGRGMLDYAAYRTNQIVEELDD